MGGFNCFAWYSGGSLRGVFYGIGVMLANFRSLTCCVAGRIGLVLGAVIVALFYVVTSFKTMDLVYATILGLLERPGKGGPVYRATILVGGPSGTRKCVESIV